MSVLSDIVPYMWYLWLDDVGVCCNASSICSVSCCVMFSNIIGVIKMLDSHSVSMGRQIIMAKNSATDMIQPNMHPLIPRRGGNGGRALRTGVPHVGQYLWSLLENSL